MNVPYRSSFGKTTLVRSAYASLSVAVLAGGATAQASDDYGPANWRPACSGKWYTSGYGHKFVVIHDMEGYYASSVSYLRSCSARVSVQYAVNGKKDSSSDYAPGDIAQMVRESYYAWHARCWNQHSVGTEHEGFVSNPAWYTEDMYQASAKLQRHICDRFGIPKDRNHVIGHDQKRISGWPSYASSHLGIDPYCNSHTDPGPYWNWSHFMNLINGQTTAPSAPSSLSATKVNSDRISLTWHDNSSVESGFKIERAKASGGPWTQIAINGANDTSYTDSGLTALTTYYYRVRAYNSAGNSGYSGVDSAKTDGDPPKAPSALAATTASTSQINLAWTQNSTDETGFKIERATASGGPWTQIHVNAANDTTYSDPGLSGSTIYYYRVRAYNTWGDSAYSAVDSATTANIAPTLAAIANKTVNEGTLLTFSASATDADEVNSTSTVASFESYGTDSPNGTVMFRAPDFSGTTDQFLTTGTNYTLVTDSFPSGHSSAKVLKAHWTFASGGVNPWMRLATFNATTLPNPTISINQVLKFDIYSDKDLRLGLGVRETATTAAIGANGGTSGTLEWVGVSSKNGDAPNPSRLVSAGTWTTLRFNVPFEAVTAFTGDGVIQDVTGKGVLEHLALVPAGGSGTYNVYLDNFVYVRDNNIVYSLVGAPAGAAIDPTTGLFTWTPTPAQAPGTYTITVKATDGGSPALNDTASFTVTVNQVNSGPKLAVIANKTVAESTALNFTATATDSDPGQTLTWSLDAGAPSGAGINPANGAFTWTPNESQGPGNYPITVRVTDSASPAKSDTKTFNVLVNEVNLAPVLAAIADQTVSELATLSFSASSSDPDSPANQRSYSLDPGAPAGASINPETGFFSWTPNETQGPASYAITVRVTDDGSPPLSNTKAFNVTVNEANTPPILAPLTDKRVRPTRTLTFTATATDADQPANVLTFSLDPGAPDGTSINPTNGVFAWTPTPDQNNTTNTITVRVSDGLASDAKSLVVTVSDANNPPVLTAITNKTVNEKVLLSFATSSSDSDGDTVTYTLDAGFPSGAAINLNSGAFTWTPTEAQGPGVYSITVRGTDNGSPALSDAKTFTVTVNEVNIAPALNPITAKTVAEKATLTFTAVASDADLPANTKTFSLDAGAPDGAGINPTNGVFTWTPTEMQGPGTYPITVRVTDNNPDAVNSKQMSDAKQFAVTVTEGNEAPVLPPIANRTVNEKTAITFLAGATDSDFPANTLTYSLDAGTPANASIDPGTGAFTWTPTEAQGPGTYPITVRVTDDGAPPLDASQTFTVVVNEANEAPVLAAIANKTIGEGTTLSFTATATDADQPTNTLTFSLSGQPSGATINPATGGFSWSPSGAQAPSTNVITVKVTDNGTPPLSDSKTFTVVVTSPNAPPVLNAIANKTVDELTTLSFTATASDPESSWSPVTISTFDSFSAPTVNGTVMFRQPAFSSSTISYLNAAATNYSMVVDSFPAGHSGVNVLKAGWSIATGTTNPWVRLATYNAANLPNPTISIGNVLKFDIYTDKALKVGLCIRETSTVAAYGANGGITGPIEFVGVSGMNGTTPIPTRTIPAGTWTTVVFSMPDEVVTAFTGNGILESTTGKAVLESLALVGAGGTGAYTIYLDNFIVAPANTLNWSLDPGAPAGASINPTNGLFSWTPTEAQGPGVYPVTVRVTDEGLPPKSATQTFNVTVNDVNNAPVVATISNKTVAELAALAFTATATDSDGDPVTWSLDAGAPSGATINTNTGAFSWTPTEAQGPGTYSVTVRATDNGSPALSGTKTFSVNVTEVNSAPVLADIPDQSVLDGQTLTLTATATDPDSPANTKTFSLDPGAPSGASINPTTGVFTWTAPAAPSTSLTTFESATLGSPYMFRDPRNSGTTDQNLNNLPDIMDVVTNISGNTTRIGRFQFAFINTSTTNWVRLTTADASGKPNPYVDLNKLLRFDIYSTRTIKVSAGIRETGGSGPVGADGGTYGGIEWVGATITNLTSSFAPGGQSVSASAWHTLTFDLKGDHAESFTGNNTNTGSSANSVVEGNWGTLESLAVTAGGGNITNTIYVDNFKVVTKTNYTLNVTVRVTDNGSPALSDTKTFSITVYSSPAEMSELQDFQQPVTLSLGAVNPWPATVSGEISATGFALSFPTTLGKTYDVEYTESLTAPDWHLLQSTSGDGQTARVTDGTAPIAQRFYRVSER